jgi:hypothetical protein
MTAVLIGAQGVTPIRAGHVKQKSPPKTPSPFEIWAF